MHVVLGPPHFGCGAYAYPYKKQKRKVNPNNPAFLFFLSPKHTNMVSVEGQRRGVKSLLTVWAPSVCFSPGNGGQESSRTENGGILRAWAVSTWPLTLPEGFHSFQMEGPTQEEPLSTVKSLREPQDLIERLLPEEQILKK